MGKLGENDGVVGEIGDVLVLFVKQIVDSSVRKRNRKYENDN
jgi:hypothetical protein